MKILVLGNCHVASLKMARDRGYEGSNDYHFVVRNQGTGGIEGLSISDEGRFVHDDLTHFVSWTEEGVEAFDGFVFVGHVLGGMDEEEAIYSSAVSALRMADMLESRAHLRLAEEISRDLGKPCLLLSRPLTEIAHNMTFGDHRARVAWLNGLFDRPTMRFLANPEETVDPETQMTRIDLLTEQMRHGNERFGASVMDMIDRALEEMAG